ncbi:MAG: hypothetical protein Q8Q42_02005 [Nanoarchaeota archaeon]|nr:hypothetical protein [Nanoarchaeota archaeon]
MGKFFVLSVVLILTAAFFAGSLNTDTQKVTGMQGTNKIEGIGLPHDSSLPCTCYEFTDEWEVIEFCPNNANRWKERKRYSATCPEGSQCAPVSNYGVTLKGVGEADYKITFEKQSCPNRYWWLFGNSGWCWKDGLYYGDKCPE